MASVGAFFGVLLVGLLLCLGSCEYAREELKKMRARELRKMIADRGEECVGCVEKAHLIAKVLEIQDLPLIDEATESEDLIGKTAEEDSPESEDDDFDFDFDFEDDRSSDQRKPRPRSDSGIDDELKRTRAERIKLIEQLSEMGIDTSTMEIPGETMEERIQRMMKNRKGRDFGNNFDWERFRAATGEPESQDEMEDIPEPPVPPEDFAEEDDDFDLDSLETLFDDDDEL